MQNGTLLLYNDLISGSDNPAKSYNWLLISSNVPVFNRAISAIIYLPATSVILVYDDDLGLYKKNALCMSYQVIIYCLIIKNYSASHDSTLQLR